MPLKVYINGKFYNKNNAKISIFDHGVLYGDGVFEGIRSYDGLIFKLREHIDRLYNSAGLIRLNIPLSKPKLIKEIIKTLKKNKLKNAYIRLVVTRGPGDLGLDPRKCKNGIIFIITDKIKLYPHKFYERGLKIVTARTRRNLPQALDPRIKSLNYLNNILAKIDAIDAGVEEAIMLTFDGYVAECTGDNIFMVNKKAKRDVSETIAKRDVSSFKEENVPSLGDTFPFETGNVPIRDLVSETSLYTPPSSIGALEGITKDAVIRIAKKKEIKFHEKKIRLSDLYRADECFLTGTAAEIIPVVEIDKKKIGTGKPGPVAKLLEEEFHKLTKKAGVRYSL